jgi:hypothetical protein
VKSPRKSETGAMALRFALLAAALLGASAARAEAPPDAKEQAS